MEIIAFNGWENNVRLANEEIELIITKDVGPRILRLAFIGERNVFAELDGQQGETGEDAWMARGGHRFWAAPEEEPKTYELDNTPIDVEEIPKGIRTIQPVGALSALAKTMDITLAEDANTVKITHILKNVSGAPVDAAPWALSVMAANGMAIIPMPERIPHTERLTHNQEWSLWGYTDFSDSRWTLGSRYIFFRQDPEKGPSKLGIAHREGWVAYHIDGFLFVKYFKRKEGATYPDGGVNFETFSNEVILELESLGELVTLEPGAAISHEENWALFRDIPPTATEDDADTHILPIINTPA